MRLLSSLLLLIGLTYTSCTTDFTLEGEWQDIPVIYGYLSVQDTAHYVRVEKVFLEPGGNAENIARIADSLYYGPGEATVFLEKVSSGQRFELQRVDGAAEGYPRAEGVFANTPNILYKIKASEANLVEGQQVRIVVERAGWDPAVAETTVLRNIMIRNPSEGGTLRLDRYTVPNSISWTAGVEARVFDVRMKLRYRESLPGSTTEFVDKTLEWVLNDKLVRESDASTQAINFRNDAFYLQLAQGLEANPAIVRRFVAADIYVTGGGEELEEYIRIANANSGITSAEPTPSYTNVEGGLGLLTSRYQTMRLGLTLDASSRDTLRNGIYTKQLNFLP